MHGYRLFDLSIRVARRLLMPVTLVSCVVSMDVERVGILIIFQDLLASLTYSNRDEGGRFFFIFSFEAHDVLRLPMVDFVRVGCDLMNFYFVYDEYTDAGDVSVAKALASIVISAMKNPEAKHDNSHILGEMTRQ